MDYDIAIKSLLDQFFMDFDLHPCVGAELECYMVPTNGEPYALDEHRDELELALGLSHVYEFELTQERGPYQVEVALPPYYDPKILIQQLERTKKGLAAFCETKSLDLILDAKPYEDQPGNGLHIHVSLHDTEARNVFFKRDEQISQELKFSLGGLLKALPESMFIFAPNENSYGRFDGSYESPDTVSWGANNRTTALRLPSSMSGLKHIEHRVPGADADPTYAIFAILAAIHHGLLNEVDPGGQVYGDAHLPMYELPRLPQTLEDAYQTFLAGEVLYEYFGDGWNELVDRRYAA